MPSRHASGEPAAVIFDMDGLLLDSEAVMRRCFDRVAAAHGWTMPRGVFESLIGLNREMSLATLSRHVPAGIGAASFDDAVHAAYDAEVAKGIPRKRGALDLVQQLAVRDIPRAVATSSAVHRARHKLSGAGLLTLMDVVASGMKSNRHRMSFF